MGWAWVLDASCKCKRTVASQQAPGLLGHCQRAPFSSADGMTAVGELAAYASPPAFSPLLPGSTAQKETCPGGDVAPPMVPLLFSPPLVPSVSTEPASLGANRQTPATTIFIANSIPSEFPSPFLSAAVPGAASQGLTLWLRFLLSADLPDGS